MTEAPLTIRRLRRVHGALPPLVSVFVLLALAVSALHAQDASSPGGAELHLRLFLDAGGSRSTVPQSPPADWQARFQPLNDDFTTQRSDHALFAELVVTLEPTWRSGDWLVSLVTSWAVAGVAAETLDVGTGWYLVCKPVAGTKLEWWNPVLLHTTAVRKTLPALGASLGRDEGLGLQVTVQPYRIVARDYGGQDCGGCPNTSRVVATEEIGSGVGTRVDLHVPVAGRAVGLFYERDGNRIWQAGVRLRLGEVVLRP